MGSGKKMTIDAQLSDTEDLVINEDGTVPMVDDLDELAQSCSIRLILSLYFIFNGVNSADTLISFDLLVPSEYSANG